MNNHLTVFCISVVIVLFFAIPIFSIIASATEDINDPFDPSSCDLWNCLSEFQESSELYDMLVSNGWIDKDVTFQDFDYILVMSNQICTMNPHVRLSLVLAMIAVESRFDSKTEYNGAKGLMQLMRGTVNSYMPPFLEEGHTITDDDIFDIRLNLATGIDYINYILRETKGDEIYALMWYNQGPKSASKDYIDKLYISDYADKIVCLADSIEPYLLSGRLDNVSSTSR